MLPLHVSWKDESGEVIYRGGDLLEESWIRGELIHGVLYPKDVSPVRTVILQNTAQERKLEAVRQGGGPAALPEKLVDVKLYLVCRNDADRTLLALTWPAVGAGIEISLDRGVTWNLFSTQYGYDLDPATWITLPGSAVCEGAPAGELRPYPPYNRATVLLRIKAPDAAARYGLYEFTLGVDYGVI